MSETPIALQEWLATYRHAAREFARASLRFDPRGGAPDDDGSRPGTYIAILSEGNSVHLGLSAAPEALRAMARALRGLPHDAPMGDRDVMDACTEVMSALAEKVKSALAGHDAQLRLGLPIFIPMPIHTSADMEYAHEDVQLGPIDCQLAVHRRARDKKAAA